MPPGLTSPASTSAIASAPSCPGSQAISTAAQCSCSQALPSGRPATSTSTTGVPVAITARTRSSCTPGRSSEATSRLSPLVQSSVRPALSPITITATSDAAASSTASAKPSRRPGDVAARRVPDARPEAGGSARRRSWRPRRRRRQLAAASSGIEKTFCPLRSTSSQRLDVRRVGVVAEEVAGAVGVGPDHGDASRRRERQVPSLRSRTRDLRAIVRASRRCAGRVDGRAAALGRRRRAARTARARTWPQHPRHRRVDRRLGRPARPHRVAAAARRSSRCRAARRRARPRGASTAGVLGVDGEVVVVGELADREVVGDDAAVEAPLVAQDAR